MPLRAVSLPVPLGLFRPVLPRTTRDPPIPRAMRDLVQCMRGPTALWGIMGRMAPRRITMHFVAVRRRRVCAVGGEALPRIHITGVAGMGRSGMMPTDIRTMVLRW